MTSMHTRLFFIAVVIALTMPFSVQVASAQNACFETDGGDWSEKPGFARTGAGTDEEMTMSDVCNGDTLTEYFCDADTMMQAEYTCANGCRNGACLPGTGLVPVQALQARKDARMRRLGTKTTTRRSRGLTPKKYRNRFPVAHKGAPRRLSIIRMHAAPPPMQAKGEKIKNSVVIPGRCAGYSALRRARVAACNPQ